MKKLITTMVILMGVSCFGAQALFIREFLIIFGGNELIIGIILANWLLSEALGSFTFGTIEQKIKLPHIFYALTQIIICFLFPLTIGTARITKLLLNIPAGEGLGILPIFSVSLFLMLPLGFLLGGQFPLICRIYADCGKKSLNISVGKNYYLEAIGFGLGGIIITCFLIPWLNSIQIAFIIGWANLITAILILIDRKRIISKKLIFLIVIIGISTGIIGWLNINILHDLSLKKQWPGLKVIDYENSVYGNTTVIQQKEQYAFYYDGMPFMIIPTPDIVFTQDIVNFPQTLAKNHNRILVLGSGLGGIINNLLQFPVKNIDYAQLDPTVIKMTFKYLTPLTKKELTDSRVTIHKKDGRLFLKQTENKFDTIILNLPEPSTLIINRYYTQEFYELVKLKLNPAGIFCFSLPGSLSYLSDEQIDINKCILNTLKSVFPYTKVIPGYNNLFLASKNNINLDPQLFIDSFNNYKIASPLFTNHYLKDRLAKNRQSWFYRSIKNNFVNINKDLKPIGVFYSLKLWNALFSPKFKYFFQLIKNLTLKNTILFIFLLIGSFYFFLFSQKKGKNKHILAKPIISSLVLASGFTGVSLNLILILSLQTFYGYVYSHFGLLISSFMAGLTLGAVLMTRKLYTIKNNISYLLKVDLVFILLCFLAHPFILYLKFLINADVAFVFNFICLIVFSAVTGFLVGFEFPLANKIYLEQSIINQKSPYNILYALDMLGSFLGAIIVSVVLIPVLGILYTIVVISIIKIFIFISFKLNSLG
ncbi:MAG: fused MFS/spermidine synthase [Candidatus Omnitrophota bacterium]